ncbi:MAG: glycosyltransferase [Planctomycetaceae bacterium]
MGTKPEHSVLAIAWGFPPMCDSGAIRNLKILRHLPEHGWRLRVLSVCAAGPLSDGQERLMAQIPDEIEVIRTREIRIDDVLGKLRRALGGSRGPAAKQDAVTPSRSHATNGHRNESAPASRSRWQRTKDVVTHVLSIPDRQVGWFPFAVWNGIRALRRESVDVIYAVGKPWTGFFVGYVLKLVFRKPLVIDFMDPWRASPWARSKGRFLDGVQSRLERFIVSRADFVIANTQTLAEDFENRLGIPAQRVAVVTCGYDEEDFPFPPKPLRDDAEAGNVPFTITHTGTFYKQRNPRNFLKAVKRLLETRMIDPARLRINFVGGMNVKDPEVYELLDDPAIRSVVRCESWIPHDQVMPYLRATHLQLLVQPATRLQIPAKLYEYAAVGNPILALCDPGGAVDAMMRTEAWGESVENDNIDGISRVIRNQYEQFVAGKAIRPLDERSIEKYSVRRLAGKLADIFEQASQPTRSMNNRELIHG